MDLMNTIQKVNQRVYKQEYVVNEKDVIALSGSWPLTTGDRLAIGNSFEKLNGHPIAIVAANFFKEEEEIKTAIVFNIMADDQIIFLATLPADGSMLSIEQLFIERIGELAEGTEITITAQPMLPDVAVKVGFSFYILQLKPKGGLK